MRKLARLGLQDTSGRLKREEHGAWQSSHRALGGHGTVMIAFIQTKKAKKERVLRAGGWWASARKERWLRMSWTEKIKVGLLSSNFFTSSPYHRIQQIEKEGKKERF
jgi:hypothetical protein